MTRERKIYDEGVEEQIGYRDKISYGLGGFGFNIWYVVGATLSYQIDEKTYNF